MMKTNIKIITGLAVLAILGIGFSTVLKLPLRLDTARGEGVAHPTFDGKGQISSIALHDRSISVNGITFCLKPEANFFTSYSQTASSCWFLQGDTVGYTLDEHRYITSLWLLEQKHKHLK